MSALLLTDKNILNRLKNEVHVWFCFPDEIVDASKLNQYHSLLSADEREKQQRFHFEKDRHSYLVSHVLVRTVLSHYCGVEADKLCFELNEYGKPGISAKHNFPTLRFNLSHTDGLSACVVSADNDCGVDVENINRKSKSHAVSERMFAKAEADIISSCADVEKQTKFFEFWTLREAYVKATGTGLGGSSKDFYFSVDKKVNDEGDLAERVAEIYFSRSIEGNDNAWQFSLLTPSTEHVAAVAVAKEAEDTKTLVSSIIQP